MTISAVLLLLCNVTFTWSLVAPGTADSWEERAPQEVRFHSLDYRNVVRWEHRRPSLGSPLYFVQYKIYGEKQWTNATHCQAIRERLCDLSQETSEPGEWYYARVQAAGNGSKSTWTLSPRFNPHWETSISPPEVKLHVTEQGIVGRLRPPSTPYRRQNGSRIAVRKLQRLHYRLYLTSNGIVQASSLEYTINYKKQEQHDVDSCVREVLFDGLKRRTTYCLQAETHILHLGRHSTKSQATCTTTQ